MFRLSSIYRRLRTNASLTNEEEHEVRRSRGEALNRLKVIQSETTCLQDTLDILHQKKKNTEKFIEFHQGLLSPIHRLFPEILEEIFWRCLPIAHNSVLSFKEAPLVLGRVCSLWRQIAYSTPQLWSSLHITAAPLSPRVRARLDAIDAWLSRSGTLPLSISMCTYEWNDGLADRFQPYFYLISKYVRRWNRIHLQIEPYDAMNFLAKITVDDLPLLEVFHLHRDPFGFESVPLRSLWKKDGILFTSSLRVLSINDVSARLPNLLLPAQSGQLTGLALEGPYFNLPDTFKVLALCPNLETCAVTVGKVSPQTISISQSSRSRPEIVLSKLRALKVYGQSSLNSDFMTLLDNLSTPALRHFQYQPSFWPLMDVQHSTEPSSLSLNSFRSFFRKLNEPLQELDLLTEGLTTNYVMRLLNLCPALKRLSLRCSLGFSDSSGSLNERLLRGFIPHEHKDHCHFCSLEEDLTEDHDSLIPPFACLCPNLEVLNMSSVSVSTHVLFPYLRSRLVDYSKYNITRLHRFSISFSLEQKDEGLAEEIDRLFEESGLPVKLECSPCLHQSRLLPPFIPPLRSNYSPSDGILEMFGVRLI